MLPEDLIAHAHARGISLDPSEARRFMARRVGDRPGDAETRRPISRAKEAALSASLDDATLEIVERAEDPSDHFVKYLLKSPDGALHEAVRIPLEKHGRYSVCLSSQVGCAMGCVFCATGRLGLSRSLRAWEMVAAYRAVRDDLARERRESRVSSIVFQGQGEPFHNYDEVIRAARVLSHPCGGRISGKAITISTVGLVPQIRRYTEEGHPYRLIVSLTSAIETKRRTLLPVAGRFAITELADAIRAHAKKAGGRMTVAMCLMGGVNTGADEVDALRALLGDVPLRVNLVDVNDARDDGFRRATGVEMRALMDALATLKVPIVRRYSGGAARHAACGMLAATRSES